MTKWLYYRIASIHILHFEVELHFDHYVSLYVFRNNYVNSSILSYNEHLFCLFISIVKSIKLVQTNQSVHPYSIC